MPAGVESGLWSMTHWLSYAGAQSRYIEAKGDFIRANADALRTAGLNTFWNGEKHHPNAALTVFRHYDSATVVQGLVGTQPQTAWLIDYPILERIHYLLVAATRCSPVRRAVAWTASACVAPTHAFGH